MATDEVGAPLERYLQAGLPRRLMKPALNAVTSPWPRAVRKRRLSLPSPSGVHVTNTAVTHHINYGNVLFNLMYGLLNDVLSSSDCKPFASNARTYQHLEGTKENHEIRQSEQLISEMRIESGPPENEEVLQSVTPDGGITDSLRNTGYQLHLHSADHSRGFHCLKPKRKLHILLVLNVCFNASRYYFIITLRNKHS